MKPTIQPTQITKKIGLIEELPMADIKQKSVPTKEPEKKVESLKPQIKMEDVALSVAKDKKTNKWVVVEINFDLESGQSDKPVVIYEAHDRSTALERFRINAGNKLMS